MSDMFAHMERAASRPQPKRVHEHKFSKFNIAMLGERWQCTAPNCTTPGGIIAPACFTPIESAKDK